MAARRPAANDIDGEAERIELPAVEITDDEFALDSVLASLGESDETARVILYRAGESGKKDVYLRTMTPQEWLGYNQSGVLTDYGGGTFRVRVYNERSKLIKNVGFDIEAPRGNNAPRSTFAQTVPAAPVSNNDDKVIAAISALASGFQNSLMQLAELIKSNQPQPQSRMQMMEEMAMMKTLFAPPPNANPTAGNPDYLEVFMKAVEFAKNNVIPGAGGETSEWAPLIGVAKELLPPIIQTYQAGVAAQATQPPMPAQPQRPIHAGPVPVRPLPHGQPVPAQDNVQPIRVNPQEDNMSLQMRMGVNVLIQNAAANNDVSTYADAIIDAIGEETAAQFASKPTTELIEFLAQYDPRVRDHVDWFTRLHADIKDALTPDDNLGTIASETLPGAIEDE